jgi:two-component system, LytTR family, sensor kinase
LTENTDHFICIIEDDGVGREKAKEIQARKQKLHKSLGASITERRLSLLNSTYGEKNTISYTDLMNDVEATGTRVEIKIPKQSSSEIKTS